MRIFLRHNAQVSWVRLAHVAAALEHDGFEAHLREQQRGKQPAGTETDDERAFGQRRRRLRDRVIRGVGRDGPICRSRAKRLSTAASSATFTSTMQMNRMPVFFLRAS